MLPVADIQALYDSLLDASFRGVIFHVIDARHEVGRRVQRFLFPGSDLTVFQDYGALDGPLHIKGLISGDDYAHQAWRLHAAFRTPGPATLVHPWLGEIQVVLEKPASISFADGELRIVRFEADFLPYDALLAPPSNALEQLTDAIDAAVASAKAWLHGALAPVAMALAAFAYAQNFVSTCIGMWHGLVGGADIIGPDTAPALAVLAATPQSTPSPVWATTTTDALAAVPAAIASSSVPTPPAAVGPGASAVTPEAADPRVAAGVLLSAATSVAAIAVDPAPGPSLSAAMQALAVLEAVRAASDITFTSQQDASAWRDRLLAALDAAAAAAAAQAQAAPVEAGGLWRALQAARAALLADMAATIGRLPAVATLTLAGPTSAWLIATYLAGDTPELLVDAYLDLVARNNIASPGLVPAGKLEILQ